MVLPLGLLNYTPSVQTVYGSPERQALVAQYLAGYPEANRQFLTAARPPAQTSVSLRDDYTAVTPFVPETQVEEIAAPERYRKRLYFSGTPAEVPSFSMDIADAVQGTYGYGPVSSATSPEAIDSYSMGLDMQQGNWSAQDLASVAGQEAAAAYTAAQPDFPSWSQITSQPIGQSIEQALNSIATPTGILGTMLGVATGLPGTGKALNAAARTNLSNLAEARAMELMGVPGYSTGQIAGHAFSITPGPFGFGQVLSGVIPDWFDIDMAQSMSSVQSGIDPNTGLDIVGGGFNGPDGGKGVGGYNEKGQFVDAFGQTAAMGTIGNAASLGNQYGLSLSQALGALEGTRNGQFESLYNALDNAIADSWGQGFDISTNPDEAALGQASWSQDMTDAADMAEAEAEAADWASGFGGWGSTGDTGDADAAADADSGFGDGSDW
jgi:hypothetical protein